MVVLRNFSITDLDEIEKLERKVFPEGAYDLQLLHSIFTDMHSINEIALLNGKIVGYVVAIILDRSMADIENIAVDPDHSRSGIGTDLIKSIEKKLYALGVRRIVLEVRDKNTEAITFYRKHGYAVMEFLKNYYVERYRGSRGGYRMIKNLSALEFA